MNSYEVGNIVKLTGTFTSEAGVATDPTAVTLKVMSPAGVVTTPTPSKTATGIYSYDLTLTTNGLYRYRFAGTGLIVAASEGALYVVDSLFD